VPAALEDAVGQVLAEPVVAATDLPAFDTAAMDGWAVAGPGPWHVVGEVLAGSPPVPLADGTAVRIATGAALPIGAEAVLRRSAASRTTSASPRATMADPPWAPTSAPARDAAAGTCSPPRCGGLTRAGGHGRSGGTRHPHRGAHPQVATLVLGDELLVRGPARDGRVRDALGPMLPGWIGALGALAYPPQHVPDTLEALALAIDDAACDVIVTTGSTARGPVDHLHRALDRLGARVLVDGVAVRPGHPMLLAALPDGRVLVGLPGNPLAAVSGLLTLVGPLLAGMRDDPGADPTLPEQRAVLADSVSSHPDDTRLVPVRLDRGELVVSAWPLHHVGPAMLRGLAEADAVAVIPPGGGQRGASVAVLEVPLP
jgi:molybdopterin molybdotransferase